VLAARYVIPRQQGRDLGGSQGQRSARPSQMSRNTPGVSPATPAPVGPDQRRTTAPRPALGGAKSEENSGAISECYSQSPSLRPSSRRRPPSQSSSGGSRQSSRRVHLDTQPVPEISNRAACRSLPCPHIHLQHPPEASRAVIFFHEVGPEKRDVNPRPRNPLAKLRGECNRVTPRPGAASAVMDGRVAVITRILNATPWRRVAIPRIRGNPRSLPAGSRGCWLGGDAGRGAQAERGASQEEGEGDDGEGGPLPGHGGHSSGLCSSPLRGNPSAPPGHVISAVSGRCACREPAHRGACSVGEPSPAATSSAPSSLRSSPVAWDS